MKIQVLHQYLSQLLQPDKFSDYCPNGLQVEGKPAIYKIVTGVTASMALLQAAVQANADAVLVHQVIFGAAKRKPSLALKNAAFSFYCSTS